jgi:hypothetical protein
MTATGHPAWCDRDLCTAPAEMPATFEQLGDQHHRSAPAALDLRVAGTAVLPGTGAGTVTAQLYQAVAPWRCETYLRLSGGADGRHLDVALGEAMRAAAALSVLLADACDDVAAQAARGLAALQHMMTPEWPEVTGMGDGDPR